jgi:hypothetical protein
MERPKEFTKEWSRKVEGFPAWTVLGRKTSRDLSS